MRHKGRGVQKRRGMGMRLRGRSRLFTGGLALKVQVGLVPLLLVIAGCSHPSAGPSAETDYLEQRLLPEMKRWLWQTDDKVFPLGRLLASRDYDELCLVPEENFLSKIESPQRAIRTYHSSFGMGIPGGNAALIAVRDGVAHAILINQMDMMISLADENICRNGDPVEAVRKNFVGTRETTVQIGG